MTSLKLATKAQHVFGKTEAAELLDVLGAVEALGGSETAFLDGAVEGTASASHVLVVDSNIDVSGVRNFGLTGALTLSGGGDLIFSGTTGQNEITFTDNLADALSIKITGGADFLVFDSTNTNEKLSILSAATQKLGFYGVTPVVQPSAYTQTFSFADKTHANQTSAALTVSDGAGTNDNTIGAITADASVIAAVQEIADEINKLVADMTDVKQLVNSVIDDLQALGLLS